MKSIKPGRGASELGHSSSIGAVIFGIIWTFLAVTMAFAVFSSGAPGIFKVFILAFPAFGIMFIVLGIKQAKFHKHNATQRNRYSLYDITSDNEEKDPLDRWSRDEREFDQSRRFDPNINEFCSNCGNKLERDHNFCPKCGKRV
jgi:ribosomal protein L32